MEVCTLVTTSYILTVDLHSWTRCSWLQIKVTNDSVRPFLLLPFETRQRQTSSLKEKDWVSRSVRLGLVMKVERNTVEDVGLVLKERKPSSWRASMTLQSMQ